MKILAVGGRLTDEPHEKLVMFEVKSTI